METGEGVGAGVALLNLHYIVMEVIALTRPLDRLPPHRQDFRIVLDQLLDSIARDLAAFQSPKFRL